MFYNCSSLLSIDLPNTILSVPSGMFYGCSSISSITIPPSVSTIGAQAFRNCRSLKPITISDAALNNTNYGIDRWGNYYNPFTCCTELIAIARSLNMSVKEYLLHQNGVNRRVAVLFSLKTIKNARILAKSEGRAFI